MSSPETTPDGLQPEAMPVDPGAVGPAREASARVLSLDGRRAEWQTRAIAVEIPVQILYGGIAFAVMMLSPGDLVDFAYGFSLTEGIVERADDIRGVTLASDARGMQLSIDLPGERLRSHFARQRAMSGRTGCGVCGIDDLAALRRAERPATTTDCLDTEAIARALLAFDERQSLNAATRAVHGAAFAQRDGTILAVREDVGRHNALDKLIGTLLRNQIAPQSGFIIISSRCSFEMVEKAATYGCGTIVAISAPTSLALDRADALGVTLVGIARRDTITVFTHIDRIVALHTR